MERVYEVTQIHLLQKMTLPTLQLLIAHLFVPKCSSSVHNYKGNRGCLWRGFVVTLVKFLLLDVSSCHWEHQIKCHFLLRLDMPMLWNWRMTSEHCLDCVVPFRAAICECSSENKRHTHDWVMKLDITWYWDCTCLHLFLSLVSHIEGIVI